MNKDREYILDMYRMMLKHYFEKGMGAQSELSNNTTITPVLVKTCLERYIELGGNEDFSDITDEKYRLFLEEVKSINVKREYEISETC